MKENGNRSSFLATVSDLDYTYIDAKMRWYYSCIQTKEKRNGNRMRVLAALPDPDPGP
jgi:hypothetical protein